MFYNTVQKDHQQLVISQSFDSQSLHSFELWLKRHGQGVRHVVASNSTPVQDDVLKVLSTCSPEVVKVPVGSCSPGTVKMLSMFRALAVCEMHTHTTFRIKDLESLDSLCSLRLVQGSFTALQLPPNLTELKLRDANLPASSHCKCFNLLARLTVIRGHIWGLNNQSLTACTRLETLL